MNSGGALIFRFPSWNPAHYESNPQAYVIEEVRVSAEDSLKVTAVPGGGFAVSFRRL